MDVQSLLFLKNLLYLLTFGLFAVASLAAVLWLWLIMSGYEPVLQRLMQLTGRTDNPNVWRQVVSESMFFRVKIWGIIPPVLFASAGIWLIVKGRRAAVFMKHLQTFALYSLSVFWQWTKAACCGWWGVALLVLLAGRIFLAFVYPFHIDSMYSYLFFVDRGIAAVLFWYPEPNNHIFYNLFCEMLHVAGLSPEPAMRLPSLFFGVWQWVMLAGWLGCRFGKNNPAVWVAIAYVFLNYLQMYFSFTGRGYMLQSLLFVSCLPLVGKLQKQPDNQPAAFFLAVIVTLGFYTIPTFLYAWLCLWPLLLLLVWNQKHARFLRHIVTVVGLVSLLYLPVLVINGPADLLADKWVARLTFQEWFNRFPAYWLDWQNELWGFSAGGVLTFLLTIALLFMKNKRWILFKTATLSILWLPVLLIMLQGVLPPSRVWTWQITGIALGLLYLLLTARKKLPKKVFRLISIAFLLLFISKSLWLFSSIVQAGFGPYDSVEKKIMPLLSTYKTQNVWVQDSDGIITLNLKLQSRRSDSYRKPTVAIHHRESIEYDAVVLRKGEDALPTRFQDGIVIFEDDYYCIILPLHRF